MPNFRLLLLLFLVHSALVAAQRSGGRNFTSLWRTLNGAAPIVIARGGFSGLFPDSSRAAYLFSLLTSLPDVVVLCDVQLTKDSIGICAPDVKLNNATNIDSFFPNGQKSYSVNGFPQKGWFSLDYTLNDLANVSLTQGLFSRTNAFDGNLFPINTVEQVARDVKPPGYWLNIQHDLFFREHNLSMTSFVLGVSKRTIVDYISSPEVSFLTSIVQRFRATRTKLVFRFLQNDTIEPSTNQSYGSLLKNLTFVKTFASGILVPKIYIWPVVNLYLQPHTSIVSDAHKEGLQVFAADFANDNPPAYNYSYDPVSEALSFIDNLDFSVDGLMSDFPITPSEAIGCFAHVNRRSPGPEKPVIVSHNGASGFYPGSTNLAYQKAVEDGADVIDCSVQMTSDGIPVCLTSIDLLTGTNVAQSPLYTRLTKVPDIQDTNGVFAFNATWAEIQDLKPSISNPFADYNNLQRNPAYANAGRFMTLEKFLKFAKTQAISGILLNVKWAAYLAEKQGLDVINAVLSGLRNSSYNDTKSPEITIQSTDSAILTKFKQQTKYKLMYKVDETIRDVQNSTLAEIKGFADSVAISRSSIFPENNAFLLGTTDIVRKLHAFGLEAYVYPLTNEFVSQAWDFFSDPMVEINTYVQAGEVDGIITDYPGTSKLYKRNSCINKGKNAPSFMDPVQPGALLQLITKQNVPPAAAPSPVLTDSAVAEQPLPPVSQNPPTTRGSTGSPTSLPSPTTGGSTGSPTSPPSPSAQPRLTNSISVSILMLLGCLLLF